MLSLDDLIPAPGSHLLTPKVQNPTLIFPTPLPLVTLFHSVTVHPVASCGILGVTCHSPALSSSLLLAQEPVSSFLPTSTVTVLFPDLGDPWPLPGGRPEAGGYGAAP